ncbi:NrsF family protein [Phyllobacterium leguminum]|uniref:DUF1109 family protein n=1 Tax=Phyllobacterium leguminum TaxID=314237 RepID=A0A318T0V3_9HYPH|nr:NrsF family protein [Phyllobacterium leguminum]PYE87279.1 hypothetical protein C7477_11414 [Phyllobacterium leguminum]
MRTDDLINLIAQDTRPPVEVSKALLLALVMGAATSCVLFFAVLGFRPDVADAIETGRFAFKFLVTLSLFSIASSLLSAMVRPGQGATARRWLLLLVPILLLGAVIVELIVTPSGLWGVRLIGSNAVHCLIVIPLLSFFPGVFLFRAMRNGAPDNPGQAGAIAALASAGIAATLYASNCPDDSPLFVAIWYSAATLAVVAIGYFAGLRFLRW